MTLLRTPKPIAIKIVRDNPFVPLGTAVKDVIEVINGPVPEPLRPFTEAYNGPLPFPLKQLDAVRFKCDVAADIERATRPTPTASGTMTTAQVCRRFGWREVPEKARAFGFPPVLGRSVSSHGQSVTIHYSTKAVERWAEDIQELVRETKFGK